MAYDIRRRNEVKKYFVHKQMPMTQAAKLAGVPVNTARRWKDLAYEAGDDWEKLRAAFALSSGSRDD